MDSARIFVHTHCYGLERQALRWTYNRPGLSIPRPLALIAFIKSASVTVHRRVVTIMLCFGTEPPLRPSICTVPKTRSPIHSPLLLMAANRLVLEKTKL